MTQLGLLSLGDLLTDPVTGVRRSEAERHRSIVDQAVRAEEVGFDAVHLGEHHTSDYVLSSPAVVLAAIAERTERITLSTAVTVMPTLDPVRVAEDFATLDVLSGGRAEIVAGRGSYFAKTFGVFGRDPADSRTLFDENVELLDRLLHDERVTWSGGHRAPLEAVTTRPRPVQQVTIWIGGGGSSASVELAARLEMPLMLPSVFASPEAFVPVVEHYRACWAAAGHPGPAVVGACCHAHVAPTTAVARDRFGVWYRHYWDFVQDLVAEFTPGAPRLPFDEIALMDGAGPSICGSPAEVVERIGRWNELLGLDRHLFMFDLGGIGDAELFATLDLFGAEVIPQLR